MHEVVEGYLEHCHESFGDNIPAAKICFRAVLICLSSGNGYTDFDETFKFVLCKRHKYMSYLERVL